MTLQVAIVGMGNIGNIHAGVFQAAECQDCRRVRHHQRKGR